MRIRRNDDIKIVAKGLNLTSNVIEKINYNLWIEFIEEYKDYFFWYEDTDAGKEVQFNIHKVPEWAMQGVIYSLNKTTVYSTDKIVKNHCDLVIRYFQDGIIKIDIEKKMTKEVAKILLEMATYVEGKLIIGDNKVLESIEQLE